MSPHEPGRVGWIPEELQEVYVGLFVDGGMSLYPSFEEAADRRTPAGDAMLFCAGKMKEKKG